MRTTYMVDTDDSFESQIRSLDFRRSHEYPDGAMVPVTCRLNYSVAFCDILVNLCSLAALLRQ